MFFLLFYAVFGLITFFGSLGLFAVLMVIFMKPPFNSDHCFTVVGITGISIFAWWMVRNSYRLLESYHRKNWVREKERYRQEGLLAIGSITLCTVIPRIFVFFVDFDYNTFAYILIIPTVTIILFIFYFLEKWNSDSDLPPNTTENPDESVFLLVGNLFLIALGIGFSLKSEGDLDIQSRIAIQVLYGIFATTISLDFLPIFRGRFEMWSREARDRQKAENQRERKMEIELSKRFEDTPTLTDSFMYCAAIVLILMMIFGLIWLFLENQKSSEAWTTLGAVVGSGLVIFGSLKLLTSKLSKKGTRLERYRRKLLIGFGGIGLSGMASRIFSLFVEVDHYTLFYIISISLISSISFYYFFIHGYRTHCNLLYYSNEFSMFLSILFHVILFLVTVRIGMTYEDSSKKEVIIWIQFAYFFIATSSLTHFVVAWKEGGVYLQNDPKTNELQAQISYKAPTAPVTVINIEKAVGKIPPRIFCKSCHQNYNETSKVPRILKECGDSICETCAEYLLKKNHGRHLYCPICEKVTVVPKTTVDRPVEFLLKNYNLLDLVRKK